MKLTLSSFDSPVSFNCPIEMRLPIKHRRMGGHRRFLSFENKRPFHQEQHEHKSLQTFR